MTLRIKIAKWLAPELEQQNKLLLSAVRNIQDERHVWAARAMKRGIALNNIKALRTPKCAHIGNRMADIAESALSHDASSPKEGKQ